MTREFTAFVLAGGLAAGVNWLSRLLLEPFTGLEAAIVLAYLVGMTTAFLLTKFFVFEPSRRQVHDEYVRFAIVNAVALLQVFVVTVFLARFALPRMGIHEYADDIAHAIGVASPVVTSYLGHRHFSFAKKS